MRHELFMRTGILLIICLSFLSVSYTQNGYISDKNQEKVLKKSEREASTYGKSDYKVYESDQTLGESLREYYEFHFTEIGDDIRKYATPTAMSRENSLEKAVEEAKKNAKNSALGVMQLYFYTWINVDERTSQEQKDLLIKAAEKAEPSIKKKIDSAEPIKSFIFYKELKKDFRVEIRTIYDQGLLKNICRTEILNFLEPGNSFDGLDVKELLIFKK